MKKMLKDNLRKIMALLLVGAMIMSSNIQTLAQDIPQADEEARERECLPNSPDYLQKFFTYLNRKYPAIGIDPQYGVGGNPSITDDNELKNWYNTTKMARQETYDTIEINGSEEGYSDLTKNMVQFRLLGAFGNHVKTLVIKNVDEIRNLYVPASVETLIIENTTLNCYKTPGFQEGMSGDLGYCTNLRKLVLKNVKFGDNYKHPEREVGTWGRYDYETNYRLNLQNCHNLEELDIDVSFDGASETQLAIDGGADNLFENLAADKCTINPAPGTGYGQVILYANENSNLAKRYSSSETVVFKNGQFRRWLLEAIGIDTNHDGVISQAEMDAIETLKINDQTAHSAPQTSLSDFQELADIEQMHGLKTLELDFYDPSSSYATNGNRQTLKGINFPRSLENLSMKNIYWEKDTQTKSHDNADIILKNLKTLELYNTDVKVAEGDSYFNHSTRIELEDTAGALRSCIIERTDVESIKLINNSNGQGIVNQDEKQRIRFSAANCQNLKAIEFLGEGYAVEGGLDLTNDTELEHIGIPNDNKTQWTVYGEFDSTYAPVNVILNGCSKLGLGCNEIVIDYDFINGRDLNVQTMNTSFDAASNRILTIKRQPRIMGDTAGKVYLSCDRDSWVYNHYLAEAGFVIEDRSSFPTIAVFADGQRIRTSGEGNHNSDSKYTEDSDRWVERWNLVMQPGGYSNNFGKLTYYVVDKTVDGAGNSSESLRKVFYGGAGEPVYVEWDKQNDADPIITLPTVKDDVTGGYKLTGNKLSSTGKPGEVELKLYVLKEENGSTVKSYIGYQNIKIFEMPNSVELVNDGTECGSGTKDDPYVIYKNEELKLKARLKVNGQVDRSGDYALRDVYWRIKEYDETPKYTSDSDGYSLYTLDSATKAGIEVVRGALNPGETEAQYDRRTDNVGLEPTYYNHRRFAFNTAGTKFKIVAQSPYKYNADGGDRVISSEVYVVYSNSDKPSGENPSGENPGGVTPGIVNPGIVNPGSGNSGGGDSAPSTIPVYRDPAVTNSTATIPVYRIPADPVRDPETPTLGVPVIDKKNPGVYVMPDPTKNEVVYMTPPADTTKKTITIPDRIVIGGKKMLVVKIDPGAFKNNENIETIKLGKNIKVIGSDAFEGATNLKKVTLGNNVEIIGAGAFKDCAKLTTVTIPSKTTIIGAGAFEGDTKLKKVTIGKNVESIGAGAFKDCKSLISISLPSKVTTIGTGAFEGCIKLKTIKITSRNLTPTSVAVGAFNGLTNNTTIRVPKSKLNAYKVLFAEKGINPTVKIKRY